jgi:hypothetical protein
MPRPVTRALIEGAHRYSGTYRGFLANHLPMGLVALDAMGASDEQLVRFAHANEGKLEPMRTAETERVAHFERRIADEGLAVVLRSLSSELAAGISTAAFHGAIRTAYAVESGIAREQAHALAYWTFAMEILPDMAAPRGEETPFEVLCAISRDAAFSGKRPAGRGISERMQNISRDSALAPYLARLDPAQLRVDTIAASLIRAYAATGDFTLLHGVTGCHAFRVLAPFFADAQYATRSLWTAVVAAYMASGSPRVEGWKLEGNDGLGWADIHARAADCDDEHDVKFAYSCWREGQATHHDLYRRAASARVCHATEQAAIS